MYFNRFDVCEAYYWYDVLWSPTEYGARLHKIGFRPSCLARLKNMSENAKTIYGKLVRENHRLYIGYNRYQRRNPNAPMWPGTANMRNVREWLARVGALAAVEAMA